MWHNVCSQIECIPKHCDLCNKNTLSAPWLTQLILIKFNCSSRVDRLHSYNLLILHLNSYHQSSSHLLISKLLLNLHVIKHNSLSSILHQTIQNSSKISLLIFLVKLAKCLFHLYKLYIVSFCQLFSKYLD